MPRNEQLMIKAELDEDGMPMEGNEDEETLQYWKKVEDGVRQWIDALACRRDIANEYFANPPAIANTESSQTTPCCNNCPMCSHVTLGPRVANVAWMKI